MLRKSQAERSWAEEKKGHELELPDVDLNLERVAHLPRTPHSAPRGHGCQGDLDVDVDVLEAHGCAGEGRAGEAQPGLPLEGADALAGGLLQPLPEGQPRLTPGGLPVNHFVNHFDYFHFAPGGTTIKGRISFVSS